MDQDKLKKWLPIALGVVAGGFIMYCIYWKTQLPDQCPLSRHVTICKVTPYHNIVNWEASQDEKEKEARTWMEKYVRTQFLNKKVSQSQQEHPNSNLDQSRQSNQGDCLRRVIANEKGLLKSEDFDHIQKIIEVYSKALLCEIRQQHKSERIVFFQAKQWDKYINQIKQQQIKEVKIYNKATKEILSIANIKPSVFNQSVQLFLISSNTLLKSAQITLYSPFKTTRHEISIQQARSLLSQASNQAIQILQDLLGILNSQNELLLVFDCLISDYLHSCLTPSVEVEQWRAACFKYGLQDEDEVVAILKDVCCKIKQLSFNLKQ